MPIIRRFIAPSPILYIFALLLVLSSCHGKAGKQSLRAKVPTDSIDNYILHGMKDWKIPGTALAIVQNGKLVYARGYGVKKFGEKDPVDENTVFAIGSNTKAFTATALVQLVFEGKLSLRAKVTDYLPWFRLKDPLVSQMVTVRDLMCHRIGLSTWSGDFVAWGSKYTRREVIERMRYINPTQSFRSDFGYSNTAFVTAGEIIPVVTDLSWEDYVKQHILVPLQMNRTSLSVAALKSFSDVATPHTVLHDSVYVIPYRNLGNLAPAAAMNSSVIDLSHWLLFQMSDSGSYDSKKIMNPNIVFTTHVPNIIMHELPYYPGTKSDSHFEAYGLGWFLQDYHGRLLVYHDGAVDGMYSVVAFMPEEKLGFAFLTNCDNHDFIEAILYKIFDLMMDYPFKNYEQRIYHDFLVRDSTATHEWGVLGSKAGKEQLPSDAAISYAGDYVNTHYGEARLVQGKTGLSLLPMEHDGLTGQLSYMGNDSFICYWNDKEFYRNVVSFYRKNNRIAGFRMSIRPDFIDPVEYLFEKKK